MKEGSGASEMLVISFSFLVYYFIEIRDIGRGISWREGFECGFGYYELKEFLRYSSGGVE